MARGAAGLAVEDVVSGREVEQVRQGEIAHHLFQAVGRGLSGSQSKEIVLPDVTSGLPFPHTERRQCRS